MLPHAQKPGRHPAAVRLARARVTDRLPRQLTHAAPAMAGRVVVGVAGSVAGVAAAAVLLTGSAAPDDVAATADERAQPQAQAGGLPGHGVSEPMRASRDALRQPIGAWQTAQRTVPHPSPPPSPMTADQVAGHGGVAKAAQVMPSDPRQIALMLMPEYGLSQAEFGCLDELWVGESNWNVYADNPTSSAYGIPQALPGERMAEIAPDWRTNPATQIRWGLAYIRDTYGSACAANSFKNANNWY